MIYVVIKGNYVIDRIVADEAPNYPHPHDAVVQDVDLNIHIGDWYEDTEDIFYRPVTGVPPDWPDDLKPQS
jgi:hypothetical protein